MRASSCARGRREFAARPVALSLARLNQCKGSQGGGDQLLQVRTPVGAAADHEDRDLPHSKILLAPQ